MNLKSILESLIFASGRALGSSEMLEILEGLSSTSEVGRPTRQELETTLQSLQEDWEGRGGGIGLVKVAEGYEFRTRPEYAPWIRLLNQPKPYRLTLPAVETLALIAYRQPITRTDIESIRGVDTAAVLKTLIERRLIRVVGRKEEPGRPLLYATTHEFLELFGLKDLADLPPLKEFEEMVKSRTTDDPTVAIADLISSPEELSLLEEDDRSALEELERSLSDLKEVESKQKDPPPVDS